MAVAYEAGAALSPTDLLTKIAAFAAANGFTVNTVTGGRVFVQGDIVVGVETSSNEIHMRGATAYNGAAAWNAQTNAPAKTAYTNLLSAGPYAGYFAFAGDEGGVPYLHVVVELTSGKYRHMHIGQLIKNGTYTGGVYVEGTYWNQSVSFIGNTDAGQHQVPCDANSSNAANNHMYIDYDSKVNNFQDIFSINSHATTRCAGSMRSQSLYAAFHNAEEMKWNLRTPFFPCEYYAGRPSSLWSPIGRKPHTRRVNLRNIGPEDEIEIGGETWKCFPVAQRQDGAVGSGIESSGYYGLAYLMP